MRGLWGGGRVEGAALRGVDQRYHAGLTPPHFMFAMSLAAELYVVRLTQAGRIAVARAAIVR